MDIAIGAHGSPSWTIRHAEHADVDLIARLQHILLVCCRIDDGRLQRNGAAGWAAHPPARQEQNSAKDCRPDAPYSWILARTHRNRHGRNADLAQDGVFWRRNDGRSATARHSSTKARRPNFDRERFRAAPRKDWRERRGDHLRSDQRIGAIIPCKNLLRLSLSVPREAAAAPHAATSHEVASYIYW